MDRDLASQGGTRDTLNASTSSMGRNDNVIIW